MQHDQPDVRAVLGLQHDRRADLDVGAVGGDVHRHALGALDHHGVGHFVALRVAESGAEVEGLHRGLVGRADDRQIRQPIRRGDHLFADPRRAAAVQNPVPLSIGTLAIRLDRTAVRQRPQHVGVGPWTAAHVGAVYRHRRADRIGRHEGRVRRHRVGDLRVAHQHEDHRLSWHCIGHVGLHVHQGHAPGAGAHVQWRRLQRFYVCQPGTVGGSIKDIGRNLLEE